MLLVFGFNGGYGATSVLDNSKEYIEGLLYDEIGDDIEIDCGDELEIYEEKTSSTIIEIENYNNDFDSQLNTYLNEINNYPKTREPIIYKIENNRYKIVNICKYQKEKECNETNEKYLNNLINAFKDRYKINILEE